MFKKINVSELQQNVFTEIGSNWLLISAKKPDGSFNTMTACWGAMGVIWGVNSITVYIRQSRYTKEFVDASEYFTVSQFEGHKPALTILGRKSGRDCDKVAEAGFTPAEVEGQPTFEESKCVFVCKKRYQADLPLETLPADVREKMYADGDYHTMYIGEIVACYENK